MPGLTNPEEHGIEEGQLRVYIAGPYTHGKWGENQRRAIEAAQKVLEAGHIPFVPHTMTGIWSVMYSNEWIKFDLKWVEVCDALIRLPGKSNGSDTEVDFAAEMEIPIYYTVDEFLADAHYGYV